MEACGLWYDTAVYLVFISTAGLHSYEIRHLSTTTHGHGVTLQSDGYTAQLNWLQLAAIKTAMHTLWNIVQSSFCHRRAVTLTLAIQVKSQPWAKDTDNTQRQTPRQEMRSHRVRSALTKKTLNHFYFTCCIMNNIVSHKAPIISTWYKITRLRSNLMTILSLT